MSKYDFTTPFIPFAGGVKGAIFSQNTPDSDALNG